MPGNPEATVYVGNLDDKVNERMLYEIMVQAGPLVDVRIPRDTETRKHKGYGFAEFTTNESAAYAVSLFTGLVFLNGKPLRFSISGQDKPTCGQTKNSHSHQGKDCVINSSLETSSIFKKDRSFAQSSSVNYSSLAVDNGSYGPGQRLALSPSLHSYNYNARLVSLGQMGLRSRLRNQDYPHTHGSC